jgi:ADP-ribose pyrophosphatase YjhB (NUDIX family)
MNDLFLGFAKKIQSIAQIGLTYNENPFDIERYQELREISFKMMEALSHTSIEKITHLFEHEQGYQTPKVDVRSLIFRGEEILMIQEKMDNCWAPPGGFADIGLTPYEIAVKEAREESGIEVEPIRLIAVLDKNKHNHPPSPWDIYKLFILCKETGGLLQPGTETLDAKFFKLNELPPLSTGRITREQIEMAYEFKSNPLKLAICE